MRKECMKKKISWLSKDNIEIAEKIDDCLANGKSVPKQILSEVASRLRKNIKQLRVPIKIKVDDSLVKKIGQLENQLVEANKMMLQENDAADALTKNFNKFLADSEEIYRYIHFTFANDMATDEELRMMKKWLDVYEELWIRPRERAEERKRIAKRQEGMKL